jgi:signal transduction histidine kinase/DNA-binding response OmpR family regulator
MEGEASSFNAAQIAVLAEIARGAPLPATLEAIVRLIEDQSEGMLCSVLLLDDEHGCLRHGAAPNLPASYVAELDGSAIGPEAGSCGTAAYRRERVIVEDIATHPYWVNYRHLALPHGLSACWSTPIESPDGAVLGTFAMYYRQPRAPTERELGWITAATHLASIAIMGDRASRRLRDSEAHARHLARLYAVSSSVSETLVRIRDPAQLYQVACRIAVDKGVAVLAWVGVYHDADDRIEPVARAGSDHGYVDAVAAHGGPAIRAIRTGTVAISNDIANDPTLHGKAEALRSGLGSVAAFPFRIGGHRRAVLVVYRDSPDSFAEEVSVLGALADNLSFAIESAENEVERRRAEHGKRTAEIRLDRNEAMLRIAGHAARLGAWSFDLPERRLTWSDEVCAIHDVPRGTQPRLDEAVAFFAPEHRDTIRDCVRACGSGGTPFDRELELLISGDRRVWVRVIGSAERNPDGAIVRVHGAVQDISERRRLEDQLRQAQKMEAVGRLASAVAHDFNNVLSVILSYASFLVDSLRPGDPVRDDVTEIQKAGNRAGELTQQLLAFSRQQILQPRVLALDDILGGLEIMLRRLLGASVTLAIHTAGSHGHVVADPGQIEQVLMNLAVNARDAMPDGGSLTIELADVELDAAHAANHPGVAPGPYVALAVGDTGVGMDAATRSRIFEPFFTTKPIGQGTGLGLSTVYGIVNQSGGHIAVDSEPGRGTVFRVYFPRVAAPPMVDAEAGDAPPIAARGTETVLVVEDDVQVRQITGATLRRAGYFVFEAHSASDAVRISERYNEPIHLLVADVVLPRASGRELAEQLARMRPRLRVLYVSGYAYDELVRSEAIATTAAFLAKPITPDALARKVREVLDTPTSAASIAASVSAAAALRPARRSTPPSGGGRHILHIDDEESLVVLTARILKRLGYQVSSFTDPGEALAAFRDHPAGYDAVVTDVTMRRMTGFELVRAIWDLRPDIPVVVTSGDFRPEDVRTAEAMNLRDLVVKPDTVEELGRVLHEAFSRPRG